MIFVFDRNVWTAMVTYDATRRLNGSKRMWYASVLAFALPIDYQFQAGHSLSLDWSF